MLLLIFPEFWGEGQRRVTGVYKNHLDIFHTCLGIIRSPTNMALEMTYSTLSLESREDIKSGLTAGTQSILGQESPIHGWGGQSTSFTFLFQCSVIIPEYGGPGGWGGAKARHLPEVTFATIIVAAAAALATLGLGEGTGY